MKVNLNQQDVIELSQAVNFDILSMPTANCLQFSFKGRLTIHNATRSDSRILESVFTAMRSRGIELLKQCINEVQLLDKMLKYLYGTIFQNSGALRAVCSMLLVMCWLFTRRLCY